MIYVEEFDESFTRLDTPLKIYVKCAETILNNESLLSFYAHVLAVGNYLNTVHFKYKLEFYANYVKNKIILEF